MRSRDKGSTHYQSWREGSTRMRDKGSRTRVRSGEEGVQLFVEGVPLSVRV